MDPDAALTELLELAEIGAEGDEVDAARMAELVLALDGWICRGGFCPARWRRPGCAP